MFRERPGKKRAWTARNHTVAGHEDIPDEYCGCSNFRKHLSSRTVCALGWPGLHLGTKLEVNFLFGRWRLDSCMIGRASAHPVRR